MSATSIAALTILRRLRHAETDVSRRELGDAVAREVAVLARDTELTRQVDEARDFPDDFDREAFAAWLAHTRAEQSRLAIAINEAKSRTVAARAALAERRVAETVAENALAAAMAERDAELARREQVELEDAARTMKRLAS